MVCNNKQDRTCMSNSAHLETAGRSALPQNVPTNVLELTASLALQFAPPSRCISILNSLPGSRASIFRTDGGWSLHGYDRLAIFHIPLHLGFVKVGLPQLSRLPRRHAVLRVRLCPMYSASVVLFTVNDDLVDSTSLFS